MFVGAMAGNLDHYGVPALKAALGQLAAHPDVDAARIGAVGFCLGGSIVLTWACTDQRLAAIAPFYGAAPRPRKPIRRLCPVVGSWPGHDFTTRTAGVLEAALTSAGIPHDLKVYPGVNDYQPQDSAAIVQSIYAYHTQILGWCDIAYNALVDKYGQVFEGRAGALTGPVQGDHTGGFNRDSWGVAMIGNFDDVAPTPIQLQTLGRLLGWRLGLDHIDPKAMVALPSAGGENTNFPLNAMAMLPTIFSHRDVGATDCPGTVAYGLLDEYTRYRSTFQRPSPPGRPGDGAAGRCHLRPMAGDRRREQPARRADVTRGDRGERRALRHLRERRDVLVAEHRPATDDRRDLRRVGRTRLRTRRALGLPTSAEIQEPQWVKQNFAAWDAEPRSAQRPRQPGHRRHRRGVTAAARDRATGSARAGSPVAPAA